MKTTNRKLPILGLLCLLNTSPYALAQVDANQFPETAKALEHYRVERVIAGDDNVPLRHNFNPEQLDEAPAAPRSVEIAGLPKPTDILINQADKTPGADEGFVDPFGELDSAPPAKGNSDSQPSPSEPIRVTALSDGDGEPDMDIPSRNSETRPVAINDFAVPKATLRTDEQAPAKPGTLNGLSLNDGSMVDTTRLAAIHDTIAEDSIGFDDEPDASLAEGSDSSDTEQPDASLVEGSDSSDTEQPDASLVEGSDSSDTEQPVASLAEGSEDESPADNNASDELVTCKADTQYDALINRIQELESQQQEYTQMISQMTQLTQSIAALQAAQKEITAMIQGLNFGAQAYAPNETVLGQVRPAFNSQGQSWQVMGDLLTRLQPNITYNYNGTVNGSGLPGQNAHAYFQGQGQQTSAYQANPAIGEYNPQGGVMMPRVYQFGQETMVFNGPRS